MYDQPCHLAQALPLELKHADPIAQAIQHSPADAGSFPLSKVAGFSAYKHSLCLPGFNAFKMAFVAELGIGMLKKIELRKKNQDDPVCARILLSSFSPFVRLRFTEPR